MPLEDLTSNGSLSDVDTRPLSDIRLQEYFGPGHYVEDGVVFQPTPDGSTETRTSIGDSATLIEEIEAGQSVHAIHTPRQPN